jgi:aryl-alcohol dehydrogenase-like predicted oxidoreductase
VADEPVVVAAAKSLGRTPAQVGLAWLLHRSPNVLLIPGTSNLEHLQANLDAGSIVLDDTTLAEMNAIPTRPGEFRLG